MIVRAGAVALAVTLSLIAPAAAGASSVSDARLRALATDAASGDRSALAELRTVDSVDGQPADLAAALNTGDPAALASRLRTLAVSAPGAATLAAGQARARAAAVLGARQYGRAPLPDPLGTAVKKVGRFLDRLAAKTPGGPVIFWLVLSATVLAAAAAGARRMTRRLDVAAGRTPAGGGDDELDPSTLERLADAADARGAYAEAIRLRFQAGLLTLGARGQIVYRPSLLTGEARRELGSTTFDELAGRFEQVAYGHATADAAQASATREQWRRVLNAHESVR